MEGISEAATESLNRYSWPGNIRELQNVIERALILSHGSDSRVRERSVQRITVAEAHRDTAAAKSK